MKKRYDEKTARSMITRNGGSVGNKQIRAKMPGIKVLGAIDYLTTQKDYKWIK